MGLLGTMSSSDKAKKAAAEILNIIDGLFIRDAQDAIAFASERFDHTIKEKIFCSVKYQKI